MFAPHMEKIKILVNLSESLSWPMVNIAIRAKHQAQLFFTQDCVKMWSGPLFTQFNYWLNVVVQKINAILSNRIGNVKLPTIFIFALSRWFCSLYSRIS